MKRIVFISFLMVGCTPTVGIHAYPYHFYETTGPNQFIVVNDKEKVLVFSNDSDLNALSDLRSLKWNVLYPNSEKIILEGIYEADGEFELKHWYLPTPFERRNLKDEHDPMGEQVTIKKDELEPGDFEKKPQNDPVFYNKPLNQK